MYHTCMPTTPTSVTTQSDHTLISTQPESTQHESADTSTDVPSPAPTNQDAPTTTPNILEWQENEWKVREGTWEALTATDPTLKDIIGPTVGKELHHPVRLVWKNVRNTWTRWTIVADSAVMRAAGFTGRGLYPWRTFRGERRAQLQRGDNIGRYWDPLPAHAPVPARSDSRKMPTAPCT